MGEHREDVGPEIHELLARRWSPRAWLNRPVEMEKLRACLEAARWAASSMNQQPWHFLVATRDQPEPHARLAACLADTNAVWASHAPVLMLSVAKQTFNATGQPNRFAWHDTGLATGALMAQATAFGLHVHAMGGFSRTKSRKAFGIPDGFEPVAAIALGYLGDSASLPADLQEQETAARSRRPIATWAFADNWGEAFPVVG